MSLTRPSLEKAVQKQFRFKLKSFSGMLSSLLILQLVGLLFSLGGTGSFSLGRDLSIQYYSVDIVVAFTMLWGFISAILIKTKAYREDDFVFVTNRLSSDLSNIVFLLAVSIVGGVTALLSGYLLKVAVYFLFDATPIIHTGLTDAPTAFLTGVLATILFIFMFSSAGYVIGTLTHFHKVFAYITPVAFIGIIILWYQITGNQLLLEAGEFYFQETSLWLFTCKILVTAGLLFAGSILISRRLEVRT